MLNKNMDSEQCNLMTYRLVRTKKTETLNAQKRARSICKARFTRCKNQLFGILDEENVPSQAAAKAARCKLGEAFVELVEVFDQLSKACETNGESSKCDDVYEEMDKLIPMYNEIESQARDFIASSKSTSTITSSDMSRVETWVTQQQQQIRQESLEGVQKKLDQTYFIYR